MRTMLNFLILWIKCLILLIFKIGEYMLRIIDIDLLVWVFMLIVDVDS